VMCADKRISVISPSPPVDPRAACREDVSTVEELLSTKSCLYKPSRSWSEVTDPWRSVRRSAPLQAAAPFKVPNPDVPAHNDWPRDGAHKDLTKKERRGKVKLVGIARP
jgi:hypothetical protein